MLGATINIYGKLTLGGNPVNNGLVAVQVEDNIGDLKLIRVVSTGTNPPPWKVKITEFLSCDSQGNPKTTFIKGSFAYFKITVESLDTVLERNVTIALNLFDSLGVSIGIASAISVPLGPRKQFTFFTTLPISNDAYGGAAICTASVLTGWPKDNGYPYCPEGSIKLTILDESQTPGSEPILTNPSPYGSFNLSFKLPNMARIGSYAIYVGARYNAWASASFDYAWLLTDIDRNGEVNIKDLFVVAKAFGSKLGDANWNVKADVDGDNLVNIVDVYRVARDFGKKRG
jgi:hypothetical protein